VKLWFWIRKSAIVLLPEQIGPAMPINISEGNGQRVLRERDADLRLLRKIQNLQNVKLDPGAPDKTYRQLISSCRGT
jgi:hypothetical protein